MKIKGYRQKRPPHIFQNQAVYFVTARTHHLSYFFQSEKCKENFKSVLREAIDWINSRAMNCASSDGAAINCANPKDGQAQFIGRGDAVNCADPGNRIINCTPIKTCCLYGWVINSNHYHLLVGLEHDNDLSKFMRFLHGKTGRLINKANNTSGQKIWQNYFETIIRSEKDFYTHLNYIHNNPLKHGLMSDLEALADYPFCSYTKYLKTKGQEWLDDCFNKYPIIDFTKGDECLG